MMDPKIARALFAARQRYFQGGMIGDPRSYINDAIQQIYANSARRMAPAQPSAGQVQPVAPLTMQSFGLRPWTPTPFTPPASTPAVPPGGSPTQGGASFEDDDFARGGRVYRRGYR